MCLRTTLLALFVILVVAASAEMGLAGIVSIRLDPADIGSHASEGTRVPSDTTSGVAQYNRTEVFVGYSPDTTLWTLRTILGFTLSQIPSGARIDNASLTFKSWSGSVNGIELYLSPEPVVESGVDWNTPNGTQPWSVSWVRGSGTGLGSLLSSSSGAISGTITMTDTTGNFASAVQSARRAGTPLTVIVTSLATETAASAGAYEQLLRVYSDDEAAASNRPVLTITYTPIQPISQSQFFNRRTLDFESFTNGFLDATADNPTVNAALIAFGITSITGSGGGTTGLDNQNQSNPNGKGLFFNGQRFVILPRNDDPFDNAAYPFDFGQVFTIDFADRYDQFGVSFHDQVEQDFTFSFYLDGVLQGQYVQHVGLTTTPAGDAFFGIQTPFLFDRVSIDGAAVDGYGIDNITVGMTPEPSALVLWTTGGLVLAVCARRRRRPGSGKPASRRT